MANVVYGWPGFPQRVVYGWPVVVCGWLWLTIGARTVVDVPVVVQRQVSMVLTVQKTSEIPQMQILEIPVVVQRQVPMVLTVQRPVEIPQVPQLQFINKFVDIPVAFVQRQVPMVLTVERFHRCISWTRLLTCLFVVR